MSVHRGTSSSSDLGSRSEHGLHEQFDASSDIRDTSDASLVVSVARSSESALAELYRRHAGPVLGLARRVLGDPTLAEEVAQEVFLRLWRSPEKFDPGRGTLRSFLLTQTHGRSIDLLRSERARRQREGREALSVPEASSHDIEREVWDMTVAERVQDAMWRLTSDERRAIELAYFGGHTYREVAVILDEPEGTIKSRIRVGLRRMRSSLVEAGIGGK